MTVGISAAIRRGPAALLAAALLAAFLAAGHAAADGATAVFALQAGEDRENTTTITVTAEGTEWAGGLHFTLHYPPDQWQALEDTAVKGMAGVNIRCDHAAGRVEFIWDTVDPTVTLDRVLLTIDMKKKAASARLADIGLTVRE